MHRSHRGELIKLRCVMVQSRMAVVAAREVLIEALGDFMCGSGTTPPAQEEIEALERLCAIQREAEAAYVRCLLTQAQPRVTGLRRSVG